MKSFLLISFLLFRGIAHAEDLKPFALKTFKDQETVSSEDLKPKGMVLNFFASWCTACIKELPELEHLKADQSQNFHFMAINAGESNAHIDKFLRRNTFSYQILVDPERVYSKSVGVERLPHTMVINSKGEIVYSGEKPPANLKDFLQ